MTDKAVKRLIKQILRVPKEMTEAFLAVYEQAIGAYQASLAAKPPPSPQAAAADRAQISLLQGEIAALETFLQTLQKNSRSK